MRILALSLFTAVLMLAGTQAMASGCFEPCPEDEVYSEAAEMCVAKEPPAT